MQVLVHHPKKQEVLDFLEKTVKPALNEVAAELKRQQVKARVVQGDDGRAWLEVVQPGDEVDFFYSVRPCPYEPPALVMRYTRADRVEALKYYRAEVHLREGGQDYDIMDWSKDYVISDLLEQYERHIHFLFSNRS